MMVTIAPLLPREPCIQGKTGECGETVKREIQKLFETEETCKLATCLKKRDDHEAMTIVDAAYWMKGCSSIGRLRYAAFGRVGRQRSNNRPRSAA